MAEEVKKSETAKREEETLTFWQEQQIFKKSLEKQAPKGEFVFYEGPPTANGRPGIHHLESRSFKDAIPRYKTMRGYKVRRRAGWDTHGLPVELEVEKQLGFTGKKDIETYGIAEFNRKCRESVLTYVDEWDRFTKRIGYWVDQETAYYTYNAPYMESLWSIMKRVNERGLLYKDYKVVPWCPRCETALSSHELAQGYEEVSDLSVTAKFELVDEPSTFFLAWTTTPWTLPGNVALAVSADVEYGQYEKAGERVILASALATQLGEGWAQEKTYKGSKLVGKRYKSLYPFLEEQLNEEERKKLPQAFQVYSADFVTTEDGTGIVHTAVLYGQDDFELGTRVGLPKQHLVESNGHFIKGTEFLEGRFVRDEEVAVDVIKNLAERKLLFSKEKYKHTYPFCWRCKTPLIYYARDSWFIRMTELKDKLIAANNGVHWEPEHIRDGRMGEWLAGVRDWAITRERYWATPLPVWETKDGTERVVIGSVEELKKHTKKSGNIYILVRHGQAKSNAKNEISSHRSHDNTLTELGKKQVEETARRLVKEKFDVIIASPYERTRETAEIIAKLVGYEQSNIIYDERIQEINTGEFHQKTNTEYHAFFSSVEEKFYKTPEGGENLNDLKRRVGEFIYDIEKNYKNKKILIVTHEYVLWMLGAVALGADTKQAVKLKESLPEYHEMAEAKPFVFVPLPHNENYELDLHRPYIDEVELISEKGEPLERGLGVLDVWFDSGGMPFAQDHYPFENKQWIEGIGYPADFISEAIDQTRGWFYTLLAIGVLMERGAPYKNVISLGHLLDEKGQKMSKSKGNVVNPWEAFEVWGVDTLRFWMYSVNAPGDSKNFDEKTVREVARTLSWLENSAKFYELARDNKKTESKKQLIDVWIEERVQKTVEDMTNAMDIYNVNVAVRSLAGLFEDLSQWYVRRIRDRIKDGDAAALETLRTTLHTSARLLAPFAPFLAEYVYGIVKTDHDHESVHLAEWPQAKKGVFTSFFNFFTNNTLASDMAETRAVVSFALKLRQGANVKVRQPLQTLTIKSNKLKNKEAFIHLIKEEVNVKNVVFDETLDDEAMLDTTLNAELAEEGQVREVMRFVQDLRKQAGFEPKDVATLIIEQSGEAFIKKHFDALAKVANLSAFEVGEATSALTLDEMILKFNVRKS